MYLKTLFILFLVIGATLTALEPVIILLGPPGSGKGTFSQYFKRNFGYRHVSIGDLLRAEVEKETPLGLQIKGVIQNGDYINPEIILEIIKGIFEEHLATGRPLIMDGFGQNEGEVLKIYDLLNNYCLIEKAFVVFLDAEDSILQQRILQREICSNCGEVYNSLTVKSREKGVCDFCKGTLVKRLNDTPEVIVKRIRSYRENIQKMHEQAFRLFPYFIFETDRAYDECIFFYSNL